MACGSADQGQRDPARPIAAASGDEAMSPAEIARRATPSVVQIRARGRIGSGFVVAADGRIATSLHVVEDADQLVVVLADGRTFTRVQVVDHDEEQDVVVLAIEASRLAPLPLAREPVQSGERVVVIGHPQGLANTVSDGLVSALRERDGTEMLQISAPVSPGSSGGPVLNDRGHVVGVTTATHQRGQNLNFAAPVSRLAPLMRSTARRPLSSLPSRFASRLFARCEAADLVSVYRGLGRARPRKVRRSPRAMEAAVIDLLLELDSCPGVTRMLLFALEEASARSRPGERAAVLAIVLGQIEDALREMAQSPKSETAGSP
jgi:S1-C subfamily serine protease